jgi:hypothetical protein
MQAIRDGGVPPDRGTGIAQGRLVSERGHAGLFRARDRTIYEGGTTERTSIHGPHMTQISLEWARPSRPRRLRTWRAGACGTACLIGLFVLATPADAVELVTAQEAALPPNQMPLLTFQGSPVRRPSITIVSPPEHGGVVTSPLALKVKLEAHGGAKIDPDSIVVTYKKTPLVNITQRIMPFISADGIIVPDAEVPPGLHAFRIELKDSHGNPAAADFSFQVGK